MKLYVVTYAFSVLFYREVHYQRAETGLRLKGSHPGPYSAWHQHTRVTPNYVISVSAIERINFGVAPLRGDVYVEQAA